MLLDQGISIMEKIAKEIKESDPEKRDHFIKSAVTLLEVSTECLRISPEFRNAFAMVHAEFLKYPESAGTFEEGIRAYRKYEKQLTMQSSQ